MYKNSEGEVLYENLELNELDNNSYLDIYDSCVVKNYYKLKRKRLIKDEDGDYKLKNLVIKAYSSGDTGSYIINAVTGYTSRCKVGTSDEKLFFTMSICTGEGRNRQPIHLYYDSPEQYEEHYMTNVDVDVKEKWHKKNKAYLKKLKDKS